MGRAVSLCLSLLVALLMGSCSGRETGTAAPKASDRRSAAPPSAGPGGDARALIGTWDHTYDGAGAEAILDEFSDYVDDADVVAARLGFVDEDTWWLGFLFDGRLVLVDGAPEGDGGTYTVAQDELVTRGSHGEVQVTYSWSMRDQALTLRALEECDLHAGAVTHCERDRAKLDPEMLLATEHTFTRSGDDATY